MRHLNSGWAAVYYLQIQRLILPFQSCGDSRRFHLPDEKEIHNLKTFWSDFAGRSLLIALTGRRSLWGTVKPPVVWQTKGIGDPEAPGCKQNNFPADQRWCRVKWLFSTCRNAPCWQGLYCWLQSLPPQKNNLSFRFKGVGVQSIHVVKDQVII